MIKHIVMFYFTDKVTDSNRNEIKNMISDSVERIKSAGIKGVIKMETVFNIVAGMPDVGLYGEFEDKQALEAYQTHPEHIRHKNITKDYCRDRIAVEWEI